MSEYEKDDWEMWPDDEDDWDGDPFGDNQDDWGCWFPGECLMLEPHLMSECYTAEVVAEEWEYYDFVNKMETSRLFRWWHNFVVSPWFKVRCYAGYIVDDVKHWCRHRFGWFGVPEEDDIPF